MTQGRGVPVALEGFLVEADRELVRRASPAGESVRKCRGPKEEAHGRGSHGNRSHGVPSFASPEPEF